MLFATYLSDPQIIITFQLILLVVLIVVHRKLLISFFLGGLVVGELISQVLKYSFERMRPDEAFYHISRVGYSFPSAHALIATIFYGFCGFCLIHVFKKPWQKILILTGTILIIGLVGISRIVLGVHWTTDVIGGWAIGGIILAALILLFKYTHKRITWDTLKFPHGISLAIISALLIAGSYFVVYYYVTHELVIRSTI